MTEAPQKTEESTANLDVTKYKVIIALECLFSSAQRCSLPARICGVFFLVQIAADIVHTVMKKLVELSVEGTKVLDLCVEGDRLIEQGTGAVYNKPVKGVKVSKGPFPIHSPPPLSLAHPFQISCLAVSFSLQASPSQPVYP